MASIDRYRPPREGYQPPAMPPNRQDKASRSPSKRRDVPPAAPTPPQHSSRSSPPRPGARPNQSPAQSGGQTPRPRGDQWSFLSEEIESTPSIIDGVAPIEERLRRAKGVNFIYQAGVILDLPQITLWVAGVFFHRFFMRYSMVQEKGGIHHYVSDDCTRTRDDPGLGHALPLTLHDRISPRPRSSSQTRPKKTVARPRTSSLQLPKSLRKIQSLLLMSRAKSTGDGETAS